MKKNFIIKIAILLFTVIFIAGCQQKQAINSKGPSSGKVTTGSKDSQINDKVLRIKYHGESIYGHLYTPKKLNSKMPIAVVAHGLGGNYQELGAYARHLAEKGYESYAFDFPGGSSNGNSTGIKQTQMSISTEERDLVAVIKTMISRKSSKSNSVLLVGGSQGGAVAALTASNHPSLVNSLALMYPAFSITHDAQEKYHNIQAVPKTTDVFGFTVGRDYYRPLLNTDITKSATKYTGPVLIVHGDKDDIVPVKYVEQASSKFKNSQLHVLKGAGHGFDGSDQQKALSLLDQFNTQNKNNK